MPQKIVFLVGSPQRPLAPPPGLLVKRTTTNKKKYIKKLKNLKISIFLSDTKKDLYFCG